MHVCVAIDAWAVGAIFYELLVGTPPFRSHSTSATARQIVSGEVLFPPHLSAAAQNFISTCLNLDPSERPTVVELIEHELLAEMRVGGGGEAGRGKGEEWKHSCRRWWSL